MNVHLRRAAAVLGTALTAAGSVALTTPTTATATTSPSVVFERYRDGNFDVWAMNADGTGQTNLTNDPGDDYDPVWSPSGTEVAFESNRDGDFDIYVMNADGSNVRNVTNNSGADDQSASWSPDGGTLAYLTMDTTHRLMTVHADGTGTAEVTHDFPRIATPSWSPDGTRLSFTAWTPWAGLFTIGADGSGLAPATDAGCSYVGAKWTPDGQRLVSARNCGGTERIVLVSPTGLAPVVLPSLGAGSPYLPAVSGDGTTVTYAFVPAGSTTGNAEVWSAGVDGSAPHALTDGSDWADDPAVKAGAAGAPTVTSVSAGAASVTVSWAPPASNGNSTVTGYRLTANPGGVSVDVGAVTEGTVPGLLPGTPYTLTVAALNANGAGAASAPTAPVAPLLDGQSATSFDDGSRSTESLRTTASFGTASTTTTRRLVGRRYVTSVKARLLAGSRAVANERVELWARRGARWTRVAVARTKADGRVAFTTQLPSSTYRVRHPASARYGASEAVRTGTLVRRALRR
jgi:Tol biopolymer transport system component